MDVYRALNADVPQLLFTVLHQAGPMVSDEDFTRTVTALHMDMRKQAQAMGEDLHRWLEQQYRQQAEETVQKLQRLAMLTENADRGEVQRVLERDYSRLARRVGTESRLGHARLRRRGLERLDFFRARMYTGRVEFSWPGTRLLSEKYAEGELLTDGLGSGVQR
jgi:aminopeptidase N